MMDRGEQAAESPVERLIETDLIPRGVTEPQILEAFRRVPREEFVGEEARARAYDNEALCIGLGQTISQPLMIGLMLQALRTRPQDTVLEIGTGSGYQAALLSVLARRVISIERLPELARLASQRLDSLEAANVTVIQRDGSRGYPPEAPYDRIIVSCAAPATPARLCDQLRCGGILVVPVGSLQEQTLTVVTREPGGFVEERRGSCVFVPMIGEDGWREEPEPRH